MCGLINVPTLKASIYGMCVFTCPCTSRYLSLPNGYVEGMWRLTGASANPKLLVVYVSKQSFKSQKLSRLQVSNCVPIKYKADKPMFEARRPASLYSGGLTGGIGVGCEGPIHRTIDRTPSPGNSQPLSKFFTFFRTKHWWYCVFFFGLNVCALTR